MQEIYVCNVCGYEIIGPVPEGYICPVCGADESHFVLKTEE